MAGNKINTDFKQLEIEDLKISYITELGKTEVEGSPFQLIRHLLQLIE